jgi:hypothetical protein
LRGVVVTKKAVITFFSTFEKKKTITMRCHLFLWFCCNEEGDSSLVSFPFCFFLKRRRR